MIKVQLLVFVWNIRLYYCDCVWRQSRFALKRLEYLAVTFELFWFKEYIGFTKTALFFWMYRLCFRAFVVVRICLKRETFIPWNVLYMKWEDLLCFEVAIRFRALCINLYVEWTSSLMSVTFSARHVFCPSCSLPIMFSARSLAIAFNNSRLVIKQFSNRRMACNQVFRWFLCLCSSVLD